MFCEPPLVMMSTALLMSTARRRAVVLGVVPGVVEADLEFAGGGQDYAFANEVGALLAHGEIAQVTPSGDVADQSPCVGDQLGLGACGHHVGASCLGQQPVVVGAGFGDHGIDLVGRNLEGRADRRPYLYGMVLAGSVIVESLAL